MPYAQRFTLYASSPAPRRLFAINLMSGYFVLKYSEFSLTLTSDAKMSVIAVY
jgi:hypothetical protein